jgi:hypothetical protein
MPQAEETVLESAVLIAGKRDPPARRRTDGQSDDRAVLVHRDELVVW